MEIEELETIAKHNMEMCFRTLEKNNNRMAKLYLDYANIAALKAVLKNVVKPSTNEQGPDTDGCMWLKFGCQNCTELYCQFNGEE
jgi:hypothetical protein